MTRERYRVTCLTCGEIEADLSDDGLFSEATAHRRAGFHEGSRGHSVDVEIASRAIATDGGTSREEVAQSTLTGSDVERATCEYEQLCTNEATHAVSVETDERGRPSMLACQVCRDDWVEIHGKSHSRPLAAKERW